MRKFVDRLMRITVTMVVCCLGASVLAQEKARPAQAFQVERKSKSLVITGPAARPVLEYQLEPPANSKLSVQSGCYFHPIHTPAGVVITEVAPEDHPHHRGAFLAWVEMHGAKDADFWGWGEHAPKANRKIINRGIAPPRHSASGVEFQSTNEWMAEGELMILEKVHVAVQTRPLANVIDLRYTLTPERDVTLSRWAFSGFCVRTRKEGKLEALSPAGPVAFPNPKHTEPESDWPSAAWYDYTLRFDDGSVAGVAVIDHPQNPKSLWHNHRDVRMLNPCIVAPASVQLKANLPLVLRYRVVAHDGPTPSSLLNELAQGW